VALPSSVPDVAVVDASGSIGSVVVYRRRGRFVTRPRTVPYDPASAYQMGRRTQLAFIWSRWRSFSDARRRGWAVYGAQFRQPDSLGKRRPLSGWNAFVYTNFPRHMAAIPRVETAPAVYFADAPSPVTVAAKSTSTRLTVFFNEDDSWVHESNGALLLFSSASVSPGRSYYRGPYRYIGKIRGSSTSPPSSPYLLGNGPFPLTPGDHWFARYYTLRQDGRRAPDAYIGPVVITGDPPE